MQIRPALPPNTSLTHFLLNTCKSENRIFLIVYFGISFALLDVIFIVERNFIVGHGGNGMGGAEKRKFKRLPLKLHLSCHRVDSSPEMLHTGRTLNVGPGGIYFETSSKMFEPGHLIKIDMSIPPTEGILEFGGRVSGFAKVLRTHRIDVDSADSGYHGVAVEFCHPPRLSV